MGYMLCKRQNLQRANTKATAEWYGPLELNSWAHFLMVLYHLISPENFQVITDGILPVSLLTRKRSVDTENLKSFMLAGLCWEHLDVSYQNFCLNMVVLSLENQFGSKLAHKFSKKVV